MYLADNARRVAYLGAFGVGNRGDDYLIEAFAAERVPNLLIGFAPLPFVGGVPFIHLDEVTKRGDIGADDLVICGGNFIWSPEQLRKILEIAKCIKASSGRVDVRCVHVTAESIWQDPGTFMELARLVDSFTVRDQLSVDVCRDFEIAVEYEQDALARHVEARFSRTIIDHLPKKLGFNFHNWGPQSLDWYFEFLATLNHFAPVHVELTYILQCRHLTHPPSNEAAIAENLFTRFNGNIRITAVDQSLQELVSHYQAQDIIISNRTHGVLIAEALGLPVVPAGIGDKKTLAVARDLKLPVFMLEERPIDAGERLANRIWLTNASTAGVAP